MAENMGDRVIDPTKNVLDLVHAETKRQDDLRDELEKHLLAIVDRELQHVRELRDADRDAISKAEEAATKRFESVNEFRQQLSDQTATFIPKSEVHIMVEALHDKIERAVATQRATVLTLIALGITTLISVMIAGVSVVIAFIP